MSAPIRKTKIALLLNIIAPSRLSLYSALADHFDFMVLHGGTEANRESWKGLEKALPNARVMRAWGWQIHYAKKVEGEVLSLIHI